MSEQQQLDSSQHRLTSEASNLPPTFGKVADDDVDMNMVNEEDGEAERQASRRSKIDTSNLYRQSDDSDSDEERQTLKARNSKVKIQKYLDDQEMAAEGVSGTFGNGADTFNIVNVVKVDNACDLNSVQVAQDFSCILALEDINYNQVSQTKIFKMQLLEHTKLSKWTVWTAAGKLQDNFEAEEYDASEFKINEYEFFNRADAVQNFEKRYQDRTANKWAQREFFREKPGKYVLQNKDKKKKALKDAQDKEAELLQVIKDNQFECPLPQDTQSLISDIFNFQNMKVAMSELGCDVDKLPLGKLTFEQIKRGHKILSEIQRLLVSDETNENKRHSLTIQLTNDFYHCIPHNFGMKKAPVIDHLLRVKEKTRMLEQLQDIIELQQVYLDTLNFELRNKNTQEVFYNKLCTKLDQLDKDSDLFKIIYSSIENTQSEAHKNQMEIQVRDIYSVYKPTEKLRFMPFEKRIHNKFLLWHGVKPSSLASTLQNGIRMPHVESAQTGYMFGKGIYFTDCASKAAFQSLPTQKKVTNRCFMLLAEVALGDMHKAYAPYQFKRSAPMYCHSVYGVGQQRPKQAGIRDLCQSGPLFLPNELTYDKPNACFLNTGKLDSNTDLAGQETPDLKLNDYIVYDQSQVKMKYLVDCEIIIKK